MKTTWIYINSLVRVLCSPLCFEVKQKWLLQYPRHLSEKLFNLMCGQRHFTSITLSILNPSRWLTFRHALQTPPQHACNSLSHAPSCAVFEAFRNDSSRFVISVISYPCSTRNPREICSHNLNVFCIRSVGICDHWVWKEGNLHSLLLLQLPRLPLTIRRMVSRDGDWLSVARATGLSADGGSRLPFLGGKRWRQESECTSLDHLFLLWLIGHPHILKCLASHKRCTLFWNCTYYKVSYRIWVTHWTLWTALWIMYLQHNLV